MIKKGIAYIISWILFWLGDLVSYPMYLQGMHWLYPIYNRLMNYSCIVQEWAGNKTPWRIEDDI